MVLEKGVLHTTEARSPYRHGGTYYGHSYWPQFTLDAYAEGAPMYQHMPVNVAARALANEVGGVETNRDGAVQIEINWRAANAGSLPDAAYDTLARFAVWLEGEWGVPRFSSVRWSGENAYGKNAPQRLSGVEWDNYRGWLGHQHAPENDHWDPGAIDPDRFLARPLTPEDEMTPEQFAVLTNLDKNVGALTLDVVTRLRIIEAQNRRIAQLVTNSDRPVNEVLDIDEESIAEAVRRELAEALGD